MKGNTGNSGKEILRFQEKGFWDSMKGDIGISLMEIHDLKTYPVPYRVRYR